jgi:hypothetical protein
VILLISSAEVNQRSRLLGGLDVSRTRQQQLGPERSLLPQAPGDLFPTLVPLWTDISRTLGA